MCAVPVKMLLRRPVGGVGRQGDPPASQPSQQESRLSRFGKVPVGSENRVVGREGPEAVVEQPVGVLAEGEAVGEVVVAAFGELVDVAGIDDGAAVERDQPVAGQGAE